MRQMIDPQPQLGEQDISAIKLDPRSRDDIPQILRGLHYIDTTPAVRARSIRSAGERIPHAEKVFSVFQPYTEWISDGKAGSRPSSGYGWRWPQTSTASSCTTA